MNPTLQEIENSVFDKLKLLNCIPIKNILVIEPNVTLKNILLDQSYVQEKLNIFIWVIFKVEAKFASEFVDSEYFASEIKCKKIIECLTILGIVDPIDFTKDKLLNTSQKHFKEIILILDDVSKLLPSKFVTNASNFDDFLSFELSINSNASFLSNIPTTKNENFEETFAKKIQIFDDPNYLSEYRTIVQQGPASSLIPSDLMRVIKNLNASSNYLENIQLTKTINKEELIQNLEGRLEHLRLEIEQNKNVLGSADYTNLIKIEDNENEFYERSTKLELYLEEICSYVSGFKEMTKDCLRDENFSDNLNSISDFNEFKVETSLGSNFRRFYDLIEYYEKIKSYFINWTIFINRQNEKKNDYETNSCLLKNNNLQNFMGENEIFIKQIEECINCLGNKIFS